MKRPYRHLYKLIEKQWYSPQIQNDPPYENPSARYETPPYEMLAREVPDISEIILPIVMAPG